MKFNGSNWVQVGTAGFAAGYYINLVLDGTGTPYVVYNNGGASVMKFDGSNWVQVGAAGFAASWHHSLAIDKDGTPYVAYGDATHDYKMSAMKFDGSDWVQVGAAGFSDGYAAYVSLAIDSTGNPYVTYEENGYSGSIMRFDGSTWVKDGTGEFNWWVAKSSLAFDNGGTLYVAYGGYPVTDIYPVTYPANVKKWDGSDWVQVGAENFSDANHVSLAFDGNGTPYVASSNADMNEGTAYKATVKKFDGSNWVQVGLNDIHVSSERYYDGNSLSIYIDSSGVPYVAYRDGANENKVSVMKFVDDSDTDGVIDTNDNCHNTASGDVVNSSGCSIVQICPCNSDWKNRSRYMQCVQQASGDFLTANLITKKEQREVSASAAKSQCGRN